MALVWELWRLSCVYHEIFTPLCTVIGNGYKIFLCVNRCEMYKHPRIWWPLVHKKPITMMASVFFISRAHLPSSYHSVCWYCEQFVFQLCFPYLNFWQLSRIANRIFYRSFCHPLPRAYQPLTITTASIGRQSVARFNFLFLVCIMYKND